MTPVDKGRHCNSCSKTVIDFSVMTDKAIQQYFFNNQSKAVCGRFQNAQIHRIVINLPGKVLKMHMPFWKKFLVACLIVFSSTLFPFETTVARSVANKPFFIQGESRFSHNKQPRILKKKKHRRNSKIIFRGIEIISGNIGLSSCLTQGFTITNPELKMPANSHDSIDQFIPDNIIFDSGQHAVNITMTANENSENRKKPEEPKQPLEFILPALITVKRE